MLTTFSIPEVVCLAGRLLRNQPCLHDDNRTRQQKVLCRWISVVFRNWHPTEQPCFNRIPPSPFVLYLPGRTLRRQAARLAGPRYVPSTRGLYGSPRSRMNHRCLQRATRRRSLDASCSDASQRQSSHRPSFPCAGIRLPQLRCLPQSEPSRSGCEVAASFVPVGVVCSCPTAQWGTIVCWMGHAFRLSRASFLSNDLRAADNKR